MAHERSAFASQSGLIRSPTTCTDADIIKKSLSRKKDASILSWPTIIGRCKLWIAICTSVAHTSNNSLSHAKDASILSWRCSVAHTSNNSLSSEKDASVLSWPTMMGRYKLWIAIFTACDTIWRSTENLADVSDASSGHLRRCSVAHTSNNSLSRDKDASIQSWPMLMGSYKLWIAIFTA
eukprot:scaffold7441_cov109-Skeletonema_dohrnii-CCMP3373.AAC.6